jgi:hypothetical protein
MKKINAKLFTALLAVVLVTSAILFFACKKEEADSTPQKSATATHDTKYADLSRVDLSKFDYKDGMLVFKSVGDYAQTIDNLLAVCDQYSADYIAALEKKLGVPIEEADEDVIADYVIKDDFFPFNPLMDFIKQFGFSESAYPVLREQEKEWLAKYFETATNPFDKVNAGYVQSALHNSSGKVMIEGQLLGWDLGLNANTKGPCSTTGEQYRDAPDFVYNSKTRKLKGMLNTTSINVHSKSGCYYKSGSSWILWLTKVEVSFSGSKWADCDKYYPRPVPYSYNSAGGGLTERYYTFSLTPTRLPEGSGGNFPSITSLHRCTNANIYVGCGI